MKKIITICSIIFTMIVFFNGSVQAEPQWYTITFSGSDMFNYTTTTNSLAIQDAPRRMRTWLDDAITGEKWSDTDSDSDGTNDFAEWASGNLSNYGFSYFNLYGDTIASDYWNQPYNAVPDQDNGKFGVDSWRNQTVNGVPVINSMGDPSGWAGGIVMANQSYNESDYAFPVWRAPIGTQLTMSNAADYIFSVDVLMENFDSAFEPDGSLRVWFGGFNVPQDTPGIATEISGIMVVPLPATLLLGLIGLGVGGWKLRKSI